MIIVKKVVNMALSNQKSVNTFRVKIVSRPFLSESSIQTENLFYRHIHVSLTVQEEEPSTWKDGKTSAWSAIQFRTQPAVLLVDIPVVQQTRRGILRVSRGLTKSGNV